SRRLHRGIRIRVPTRHGASLRREVGVDDVVVRRILALRPASRTAARPAGPPGRERLADLLQFAGERPDAVQWGILLDGLAGVGDEHVRSRPLVLRRRVTKLAQAPLDLVRVGLELVAGVDELPGTGVGLAVALGLGHHTLHFGPLEVAAL